MSINREQLIRRLNEALSLLSLVTTRGKLSRAFLQSGIDVLRRLLSDVSREKEES